jgi:hypothetical protein
MKKLFVLFILIISVITFTMPAWSKGGKDGDPPVKKSDAVFKAPQGVVWDGDPPAPPKN